MLRAAVGFALYLLLVPALLFLAAGTLEWPMGWLYAVLLVSATLGSRLLALKRHPDLLRERAKFAEAEGAQSWDRRLVMIVGIGAPALTLIVAGLDYRNEWSPNLPPAVQWSGAVLVALGYGLGVWAMAVNRFFSAVARIQLDRGQVVVTGGPYQIVRHPAYAGGLLGALALPAMLSTLWAWLPATVSVGALIVRTRLEDQMLLDELPGYSEYAAETHFRLIPGLW